MHTGYALCDENKMKRPTATASYLCGKCEAKGSSWLARRQQGLFKDDKIHLPAPLKFQFLLCIIKLLCNIGILLLKQNKVSYV